MITERVIGKSERKVQVEIDKKIHKTHFPVIKIPLRDDGHDSSYEWKDLGNGHWKRVPKKKEEE